MDAVLARGIEHRPRLAGGCRQRLLAEHVFARSGRADRPFGMQAIGQGDIDRVDFAIGQQGFIGAEMARNREFPSECSSFVGVAAGDGAHRHALGRSHARNETAGDVGRAENADAKRWCSHRRASVAMRTARPASTVPISQRCTATQAGRELRNAAMLPAMNTMRELTLMLTPIWVMPRMSD